MCKHFNVNDYPEFSKTARGCKNTNDYTNAEYHDHVGVEVHVIGQNRNTFQNSLVLIIPITTLE